jgi:hypothetical protein
MSWKQMLTTDIIYRREFSLIDQLVWAHITYRIRREDGLINFYHGNKNFQFELKRGQMVFKVRTFCDETGMNRKKVTSAIANLAKWYHEMNIETKPFGLIITVKNPDKFFSFEPRTEPRKHHESTTKGTTSKNTSKELVKSGKLASSTPPTFSKNENSEQNFSFKNEKPVTDNTSDLVDAIKPHTDWGATSQFWFEILKVVQKKPKEDQKPYLEFVLENKNDNKNYMTVSFWHSFFWQDYLSAKTSNKIKEFDPFTRASEYYEELKEKYNRIFDEIQEKRDRRAKELEKIYITTPTSGDPFLDATREYPPINRDEFFSKNWDYNQAGGKTWEQYDAWSSRDYYDKPYMAR